MRADSLKFASTLTVGDKFALQISNRFEKSWNFYTVTRITASQLVGVSGSKEVRVRRSDGYIIGGSNSFIRPEPITKELLDQQERGDLLQWSWNLDKRAKALTTDQLRRVKAIFDEVTP